MPKLLPISALLPTCNRAVSMRLMLESLAKQTVQPAEIIVIDSSDNDVTRQLCEENILGLDSTFIYHKAREKGAAIQRNQAMEYATQDIIWLIEDDIFFEEHCLEKLWQALHSDPLLGGVNAMITNQKYESPGRISQCLFRFLHGKKETSYAGKCIGPALNLLPEDDDNLPEVVYLEWMNTGCTLYHRHVLPKPLFPPIFIGYSLMEDVTLSLTVAKRWKLANARTARIFHDSQPGDYKSNVRILSQMDLVNRHYVMTQILERSTFMDYFKLVVLQLFGIAALFGSHGKIQDLPAVILGKILGLIEISKTRYTTVE